ncbi:MAG: PspC domain-containing protein [Bacteroidales bacterium]|jgi:phage shock protein PspC (stress-responsive transcriptional regulator)|nr:PspC domain-containing protein [Bacteroidales bacterium]
MKKVVSIHLNNKVFQIEEEAYSYLNNVLSVQLKKAELEVQIAERLEQKISGSKTVIIYPDVAEVLYQLGFSAFDGQAAASSPKKLYRQPSDKMIAGVCTGLGEYFGVDCVSIRFVFIVAFFLLSAGLWLYLALWIIIPQFPKPHNTSLS